MCGTTTNMIVTNNLIVSFMEILEKTELVASQWFQGSKKWKRSRFISLQKTVSVKVEFSPMHFS